MGTMFFQEEGDSGAEWTRAATLINDFELEPLQKPWPEMRLPFDDRAGAVPLAEIIRNAAVHGYVSNAAPFRLKSAGRFRLLNREFDAALKRRAREIVEGLFGRREMVRFSRLAAKFTTLVRRDPDLWCVFREHAKEIQLKLNIELLHGQTFLFLAALYALDAAGCVFDVFEDAFRLPDTSAPPKA